MTVVSFTGGATFIYIVRYNILFSISTTHKYIFTVIGTEGNSFEDPVQEFKAISL